MKLVLPLLALATTSYAQYFSAGWSPGQQAAPPAEPEVANFVPGAKVVPTADEPLPAAPTETPASTGFSLTKLYDMLDINKLLVTKPAVELFDKFGINITDKVQAALAIKFWDERVELITDNNYNDLIVNEKFSSEQEEKDRTWVIVISVTSARQDGISKYVDQVFDQAYNETILAGDLPNVRWGRIDYLNVTHITTKWGIWQAPYLVILKDRGQTLRFYRHYQVRLKAEAFREFLQNEGWKLHAPWSTAYAPGGDKEYIMEYMAKVITVIYVQTTKLPKWVLLVISGSLGSVIIGFLHKSSTKEQVENAAKEAQEKAAKAEADAAALAKSTEKPKTKKDKGKAKVESITPAATDSEREGSAKRTTRQRKSKK